MAILTANVNIEVQGLAHLAKIFPDLNARYLMYVGEIATAKLKHDYLSGQEINIRGILIGEGKDKKGRRMVSRKTNKRRNAVYVSSYPVNLFERGRLLRSGAKEPGKYIITKKLKQQIAAGIASYSRDFENNIMNHELRKLDLQ